METNGYYFLLWSISLILSIRWIVAIEVTIAQGKLLGSTLTSRNGNQYYGFHSIPYAKPPIGNLRFQSPQEPESWTGIRDATKNPPMCAQSNWNRTGIFGQEDCLYLNVFTQQIDGSFPVLVFIHGGAFIQGCSTLQSAHYLMDQRGLVYVSINYRLGALGFLCSGDESLPGNNGLKDQTMALKWIQNNIALFGGDPKNVVIWGQSAGAASVHLHMFSHLSRGLFNKAVTFSGSALNFWSFTLPRVAKNIFSMISFVSGCSWVNTTEQVQCLRTVPVDDLIRIVNSLYIWKHSFFIEFGPTLEPETVRDSFLTRKPQAGEELDASKISWIAGVTSAEGIMEALNLIVDNGAQLKQINADLDRLLPLVAAYGTSIDHSETSSIFTEQLKKMYFQNRDISLETIEQMVNLTSDTYFIFGTVEAVSKYKGRRYLYYNSYKAHSVVNVPFDERLYKLGVCHGEDMAHYFEFYAKEFGYGNITDARDLKMSEELIKILVDFSTSGEPNTNVIGILKWDPVSDELSPYMHIGNHGFQMETDFFKEKYGIWKNVSQYLVN